MRVDGWTPARSLCRLSLREITPFRGAKGDFRAKGEFTQRENGETTFSWRSCGTRLHENGVHTLA